ncbi:hypothetical protein B7R25_12165 [Subtercola boreus]|uniref:Uncharacterized protein n=1 Tax=Subtercola boreus TaxID=120213 RepID=A0A3E0WA64_9MICO|nr:hypothetical protein B7R24_12065 [Subtercola boreus]RFA19634.1 hypothetical protein B7R23_12045 [Subtercola boreus]RFA25999.1 hypothetical protein B7R25_12165 [Subtercola boreus]
MPIIALGTLMLSGCGVANVISPPFASAIYATPADAAGAAETVALPSWVPADATFIRIKTDETTKASIMMFSPGATPPTFTACDPASDPQVDQSKSTGAMTAELAETWWPQKLNDGVVPVCAGVWHLFGQDDHYYAWTP